MQTHSITPIWQTAGVMGVVSSATSDGCGISDQLESLAPSLVLPISSFRCLIHHLSISSMNMYEGRYVSICCKSLHLDLPLIKTDRTLSKRDSGTLAPKCTDSIHSFKSRRSISTLENRLKPRFIGFGQNGKSEA